MSTFHQRGHGMLTAIPSGNAPAGEQPSPEALGALSYQKGDMSSALRHYEEAVRRAPSDPAVQKALADFYLVGLGKRDEAYAAYKRALALRPDAVDTLQILANLAVTAKRFSEAREHYTAILKLEPWNHQARRALATMPGSPAVKPSDGETGDVFRSALTRVQRSVSAGDVVEVGRGLDRLLDLKRAAAEPAAEPVPEPAQGRSLVAAGRLEEAAVTFERHLERIPGDGQTHNDLGVVCYRLGAKDKALEHYEAAVRLDPDNVTFIKNLADFLLVERQDLEKALSLYVQALRSRPRDVELLGAIAYVSAAAGREDDARYFLSRILDIEPWNSSVKEVLDQRPQPVAPGVEPSFPAKTLQDARAHLAAGNLTGARAALESLLAASPQNAAACNDLAIVCYRLGQKDEALELFQSAVQYDPDEPAYQKNLADALASESGNFEEALRIYVELLRRNPRDADTLVGLGNTCRLMGRTADARDFYTKALVLDPALQSARDALSTLGE